MAGQVFDRVLPLAERLVLGHAQRLYAKCLSSLAVGIDVVDANHHRVSYSLLSVRRASAVRRIRDDKRPAAKAKLCSVIADPDMLDEPEGAGEPIDGGSHVRIGKDRRQRG